MDEIIVMPKATLSEFIEGYRRVSLLKDPKLVRIAVTFRDGLDGSTETMGMNHKTYEHEE